MAYLFAAAIGYVLGCSNMAWYLAKYRRADLTAAGSGNLGASNATMLLGWSAGILVALHDVGKAVLAAVLARLLMPELKNVDAVAGVACVLGHIFPLWLKGKGGKGFASYFGVVLALNWKLALVIAAAVLLVTLVTDYIVCGTVTTIISAPVYIGFTRSWPAALILLMATAVIIWKHRENFLRMRSGTEFRVRSVLRGDRKLKR